MVWLDVCINCLSQHCFVNYINTIGKIYVHFQGIHVDGICSNNIQFDILKVFANSWEVQGNIADSHLWCINHEGNEGIWGLTWFCKLSNWTSQEKVIPGWIVLHWNISLHVICSTLNYYSQIRQTLWTKLQWPSLSFFTKGKCTHKIPDTHT